MGARRVIGADSSAVKSNEAPSPGPAKSRFASRSDDPAVLADIYRENINIAIWQRELSHELQDAADSFVTSNGSFTSAMSVSPESALSSVTESLGTSPPCALSQSIAELVEMFCCLLGLDRAGLRLSVLSSAMCPKFHVDRVPCRLVTTYSGAGTEWLHHSAVDRSKLGVGSGGRPDRESGLMKSPDDIERLNGGDVALLKGELWHGNEDAGLVHRSPAVATGEARLLVTIDVSH